MASGQGSLRYIENPTHTIHVYLAVYELFAVVILNTLKHYIYHMSKWLDYFENYFLKQAHTNVTEIR